MKIITTLLLAVLLCGIVSAKPEAAKDPETLQGVLENFSTKAKATKVAAEVINKQKGTVKGFNGTLSVLIAQMATPGTERHSLAWGAAKKDEIATKPLTELRKAVAALPPSAEAKTFLARALDPSLAAIAAYKANDAEISRSQVEALAQLHAALSQAK
jgi:hypothetical protein